MGLTWTSMGPMAAAALAACLAVCLAALVGGWVMRRSSMGERLLGTLAAFGIGFQVVHFAEHIIQFGYWVLHPDRKPYITPWATSAVDGFAFWCQTVPGAGGGAARGNEVLHFVGNSIFLAGLVGMYLLAGRRGVDASSFRSVRWALWVQGIHVVEHAVLTVTFFATGEALGMSTMFGIFDPTDSFVPSYRVVWHFVLNLVATAFGVWALRDLRRAGAIGGRRHVEPAVPVDLAPSV